MRAVLHSGKFLEKDPGADEREEELAAAVGQVLGVQEPLDRVAPHELEDWSLVEDLLADSRVAQVQELRDRDVELEPGEFFIVPRGVEHKPAAASEAHVLLLEPSSTLNTGNVRDDRTVDELQRL